MVTSYRKGDIEIGIDRARGPVVECHAVMQLRTRFGKLWPAIEARVAAIDDPALLDRLLERIPATPADSMGSYRN